MTPLIFAARHGSWVLVAGLCAGLAMPSLAQYLLAWIPHMVVALLFLAVFRMDPGNIAGSLKELPSVALVALGLQLVLPLAILGAAYALGCADTALVTALVIMSAAPSIVGIPTLCILLGRSPVLAMRLLVVGTAVLPVTILPVFLLLPQLGDVQGVLIASLRLLGAIVITASVAGGLRRAFLPTPTTRQLAALEGISAIALAIFVIGLMSPLADMIFSAPRVAAFWLVVAFAANFGLQIAFYLLLRSRVSPDHAFAVSLIAGNRNVSLFLVGLAPAVVAPILVFVACYQIPMFLTPLVMRRLYRQAR